jgi:hypothetical protein
MQKLLQRGLGSQKTVCLFADFARLQISAICPFWVYFKFGVGALGARHLLLVFGTPSFFYDNLGIASNLDQVAGT